MEINGRLIIADNINKNNIKLNNNQTDICNNKMINDLINKKNSDFIKRKYSGKINGKMNYHTSNPNEDGVYNLII